MLAPARRISSRGAPEFEELLQEGESAPLHGWGFAWFDGRATEERPSWRYLLRMSSRMARVESALDLQTGGGEVLAEIDRPPRLLIATEGWPTNVLVARRNLGAIGAAVVQALDAGPPRRSWDHNRPANAGLRDEPSSRQRQRALK